MSYLDNTGLAYFWEKIKSNFLPATKEIPANADLNDYKTPGVYYCPSNSTVATLANVPCPVAFSLQVYATIISSSEVVGCRQILMSYQTGVESEHTNRIWTRAFYSGGWTDWYQITTSMDRPIEYTTVGYNNSEYEDKPWNKVATFLYTADSVDRRVTFTVTDSFMPNSWAPYGRVDAKYGILRVHVRRNQDFMTYGRALCKLTWALNTGYDTEDFVLIYIPNTNTLELWTRVPNRWNRRTFNVIENGSVYGGNRSRLSANPLVTYGNVNNVGQASYPTGDGYIVFKSVMADIQQAAKGIKDCGIEYDLIPERLGTANGFLAGDSILKYFNSGSSMSVENGAPTYTDGINRRDGHVLHMPWDNAGGWDSMLAVPDANAILSDGSMSAVQWRAGIGSNGVTTDENGNAIQTRYTNWFHLIDDRFTVDGVHIKKQHTTHYGVCSTAAATAVKTVDIPHFELVTGAYVIVTFTVTNSAAVANLKLNVSNTGAKPIKYRNANLAAVGDLIANRPFMFVYDGTNWQLAIDIDHDSNNYERVRTYHPIKAKSAITAQHVIVAGEDGLYFMLTSGNPFSIKYPPLYAAAAISANAKSLNAYYFGFLDAAVNEAAETLVLDKALYIKGHLNGTTFTPFATKPLVCTEPTTEDGYQYLKLGVVKAYSTSNDAIRAQIEIEHPIYEYVNGSFCLYEPKATNAEIDALFD